MIEDNVNIIEDNVNLIVQMSIYQDFINNEYDLFCERDIVFTKRCEKLNNRIYDESIKIISYKCFCIMCFRFYMMNLIFIKN
jgi:hypothetical protein